MQRPLAGMAGSIRSDAKEVRRRWFAISQERPVEGELSLEDRVKRLAEEFAVTPAAMRVRLQQMRLILS
jgi:hypothetical protein